MDHRQTVPNPAVAVTPVAIRGGCHRGSLEVKLHKALSVGAESNYPDNCPSRTYLGKDFCLSARSIDRCYWKQDSDKKEKPECKQEYGPFYNLVSVGFGFLLLHAFQVLYMLLNNDEVGVLFVEAVVGLVPNSIFLAAGLHGGDAAKGTNFIPPSVNMLGAILAGIGIVSRLAMICCCWDECCYESGCVECCGGAIGTVTTKAERRTMRRIARREARAARKQARIEELRAKKVKAMLANKKLNPTTTAVAAVPVSVSNYEGIEIPTGSNCKGCALHCFAFLSYAGSEICLNCKHHVYSHLSEAPKHACVYGSCTCKAWKGNGDQCGNCFHSLMFHTPLPSSYLVTPATTSAESKDMASLLSQFGRGRCIFCASVWTDKTCKQWVANPVNPALCQTCGHPYGCHAVTKRVRQSSKKATAEQAATSLDSKEGSNQSQEPVMIHVEEMKAVDQNAKEEIKEGAVAAQPKAEQKKTESKGEIARDVLSQVAEELLDVVLEIELTRVDNHNTIVSNDLSSLPGQPNEEEVNEVDEVSIPSVPSEPSVGSVDSGSADS